MLFFGNPEHLDLAELDVLIRSKLVDEMFFYTTPWELPSLFPDTFDPYIDPTWHEFENVEYNDELATRESTSALFMDSAKRVKW